MLRLNLNETGAPATAGVLFNLDMTLPRHSRKYRFPETIETVKSPVETEHAPSLHFFYLYPKL